MISSQFWQLDSPADGYALTALHLLEGCHLLRVMAREVGNYMALNVNAAAFASGAGAPIRYLTL